MPSKIKMKLMYLERLKFHHDALRKGPKLFKEVCREHLLYMNGWLTIVGQGTLSFIVCCRWFFGSHV